MRYPLPFIPAKQIPSFRLGFRMAPAKAAAGSGTTVEVPGEVVILQPLATQELLDTFTPDESFVGHSADITGQAYTEAPNYGGGFFGTVLCSEHLLIGTTDNARVAATSDVVMPSPDQYLEVGLNATEAGLDTLSMAIRYTDADVTGYTLDAFFDSPTTLRVKLWATANLLADVSGVAVGASCKVGLAAFRNEIRAFVDGVAIAAATNDEIAQVGNPFVLLVGNAVADGPPSLSYIRAFSLAL